MFAPRLAGRSALHTRTGRIGIALVIAGEALILARLRPLSDFYFPVVWLGYILTVGSAVRVQTGHALWDRQPRVFILLFPLSAAFWWLFEFFNSDTHNWVYVGAQRYTGWVYAAMASLDFSTVLPAVWCTALFVAALLPESRMELDPVRRVPARILVVQFAIGALFLFAAMVYPRYAFALIWGCMCLLVDPLNCAMGRPSIIRAVWNRHWRYPFSFAAGALMCGFFWEAWNFWAMPKWTYSIPYVGWWHIFEMPALGWLGYLPFGLELFAMTNFVLLLARRPALGLEGPREPEATSPAQAAS